MPNQQIAIGFSETRCESVLGEFPLYVKIGSTKGDEASDSILIYIDLLSGYLWIVNQEGELIHSVMTGLASTRMFMALIIDKDEDRSCHSLQLSYITPKAVNPTVFTRYINTINSTIEEFLSGEIRFFQNVLQTADSENRLRVYCKQMRYITVYYFLLHLQTMDPLFPLPLRFADLMKLDLAVRVKLKERYPSLFETDSGMQVIRFM